MLIVIVCLLYLECATVTPADVDMCLINCNRCHFTPKDGDMYWIKLLEAWRWLGKKFLKAVAM